MKNKIFDDENIIISGYKFNHQENDENILYNIYNHNKIKISPKDFTLYSSRFIYSFHIFKSLVMILADNLLENS